MKYSLVTSLVLLIVGIVVFSCTNMEQNEEAGNWPMWRHDARHSAAMQKDLPSDLHLQWKREFKFPEPAFPNKIRMNFDANYEPVASGNTIFVPSMVTGSVTALDTRTGREKWKFYSDGPVRFAPIVSEGKVYFASDDGFLYCLDAASGKVNWKFWAAPGERKPYKLLGNGRLISRWPVRGGPVMKDGIIYFGSGMWPSEGVYVCAVDAESGELIWRNNNLSFIEKGLVDHGARRDIGLTPLGYLTVAGDKLIVPVGRALPAIFSLRTGEMEPYSTGWGGRGGLGRGSWWVAGMGDHYLTNGELYGLAEQQPETLGKNRMTPGEFAKATSLSLETVRDWMQRGKLTVVEQDDKKLIEVETEKSYLTPSGNPEDHEEAEKHVLKRYPRLQIDPGNKYNQSAFRRPVVTSNTMFYSVPEHNDSIGRRMPGLPHGARNTNIEQKQDSYSKIEAYDISGDPDWGLTATQNSPDAAIRLWRTLQFDKLWELSSDLRIHLKAGNRLYGGAPGVVAAVDVERDPQVIWKKEIEGTPSTMLVAGDRLFVVTQEGMLYCFGSEETKVSEYTYAKRKFEYNSKDVKPETDKILSLAEGKNGYCFVLGLPESNVIEEICQQTELDVIVLESDLQSLQEGRERFESKGIYGTSVHIVSGDLSTLQLPSYIANLVISVNPDQNDIGEETGFTDQLASLLRPYSGMAVLSLSDIQYKALRDQMKQLADQKIQMKRTDEFTILEKTDAPEGSAGWTHETGTPANTFSNRDETIKLPMGVSWFGGRLDDSIFSKLKWDYTHSRPPRPLVCDGRMFFMIHNELHAIDVYTGRPLWKTSLQQSSKIKNLRQEHFTGRRNTAGYYIATSDVLYIMRQSSMLKLDPTTGSRIGEITTPDALKDGSKQDISRWYEARIWEDNLVVHIGQYLVCMDRHTGALQWNIHTEKDRFGFAVGDGKVFAVDYWQNQRRKNNRHSEIQALSVETGKPVWSKSAQLPSEGSNGWFQYKVHPIPPYLSYSDKQDVLLLSGTFHVMSGYAGKDGEQIWEKPEAIRISRGMPPLVLSDRFITRAGKVYDLATGDSTGQQWGRLRGCNRAIANQESVLVRDGLPIICTSDGGCQTLFMSARSGCTNNLIPGDGVLTVPDFAVGCACNYPVFTSFGAVHMAEAKEWRESAFEK